MRFCLSLISLMLAMGVLAADPAASGGATNEVVFAFSAIAQSPEGVTIKVSARNNSNGSLWYYGYEEGAPIYAVEAWKDEKAMDRTPGWFCATGLKAREFPPGSEVTLQFTIPNEDYTAAVRCGFAAYRKPPVVDRTKQMYWSERVTPAAHKR
jgi:hypothetical protein